MALTKGPRRHEVVSCAEVSSALMLRLRGLRSTHVHAPPEGAAAVPPRSQSDPLWFVSTTTLLIPDFLNSLRKRVFPAYKRFHSEHCATQSSDHESTSRIDGDTPRPITWQDVQGERGEKLRGALLLWATEFNIEGEVWVMEAMLPTLGLWLEYPKARRNLEPLITSVGTLEVHEFRITMAKWKPGVSRTWYKRHFVAKATLAVEKYLRELPPQTDWTERSSRISEEARANLVLFQVAGMNVSQIEAWWGDRKLGDRTSVGRGIARAAKEIGLTLRESPLGRPKKAAL